MNIDPITQSVQYLQENRDLKNEDILQYVLEPGGII